MTAIARMGIIALTVLIGVWMAIPAHAAFKFHRVLCRGPLLVEAVGPKLILHLKRNGREAGGDGRYLAAGACAEDKKPFPKRTYIHSVTVQGQGSGASADVFAATVVHLCARDSRCVLRFSGRGRPMSKLKTVSFSIKEVLSIRTFYPRFETRSSIQRPAGATRR